MAAQCLVCGLGLVRLFSEEMSSDESSVDEASGAAVGVGCPGSTAQGNVPTGNAGSKVLVAVLTALGERDGAVRDTERRAGDALQTMTSEEGLSLRQAVEWWGSGALTGAGGVSATATRARPARRQRPMSARHMPCLAIRTVIRRPPLSALRPQRSASSWMAVGR